MFLALFYQYLSFKARPLKKPGYLSHKSTADPKAAMLRHWFPFNAEPAYGKSINSIVMVIIGRRAPASKPPGVRKCIGTGVVQFYRHRQEPVPWTRRSKNGRLFRRPRTTNERRAHFSNKATKEILEFHGVAFKLRQELNSERLPNAHDDLSLVSAKLERASRNIAKDRRLHQPPNPQPSFLGLVKCGGHCLTMPSGKYRRRSPECQSKWRGDGELPPGPASHIGFNGISDMPRPNLRRSVTDP